MAEAWQQALLHGGLGMLGGNQQLSTGQLIARGIQGGLAGMNAQKQQGREERQDMLKMAELQGQLQDAQLNRERMAANFEAQQEERKRQQAAALGKQGHMEALAAGKTPEEQALIFAGGDKYIEGQLAGQAPMTAAQREAASLGRDQLAATTANQDRTYGLSREEFDYKKSSGGDEATRALMTRRKKIQDAMRLQGLDEATATALVDSQIKTVTDPVSGKSVQYNSATGDTASIEAPRKLQERLGTEKEQISMGDMAAETGAVPILKDFWARTAGQVDESIVDTERAKAATALRHLKHRARSALMNNPRGAVWEQQQIDQQLPEEGFFESPARAEEILKTTRDMLETQHDANVEMINSGDLTSGLEQELRAKNVEIKSVYNLMREDEGQGGAQPQQQPQAAVAPEIATASQGLGVDPSTVMQAAQEAGVSPEQIIQKLQERAQ